MVSRKICKLSNCASRAWHGEFCNYHALERYRGRKVPTPTDKRLAEGKRLLRQKARELGIVLDEGHSRDREHVTAAAGRKIRSPVA